MAKQGLKIEITGLKALDRKLKDPKIMLSVRRAGRQGSQLIAGEARRNAPSGVAGGGGLQGAISVKEGPTIPGTILPTGWTILGGIPYAIFVEKGRKPGKSPPTRRGSALRRWVRLVLKDERLVYAVAKTIAREGTKPQPFLIPALKTKRAEIKRLFNQSIVDMQRWWERPL